VHSVFISLRVFSLEAFNSFSEARDFSLAAFFSDLEAFS